jgi:chaperone BCS1
VSEYEHTVKSSEEPIKKLLQTAMDGVLQTESGKVALWHPTSQPTPEWQKKALRASRDAKTVVIDPQIRENLFDDIEAFLQPGSDKDYHARGIPHRRGYLIYGPPGTGKTSLVHVIASEFGLPIYFLSLKTLTDESLFSLTMSLPHRCLLLIEDIDAAGLDRTSSDPKQGVTLSGYLNATDGFAAPEGKLLVITTNNPKSLDSAILRPGRVDYQVCLTNASNAQAKQLFQNNYRTSMKEGIKEDIESMAQTFADKVPELMFSPAKIQQYLRTTKHRDSPETALENVSAWLAKDDLPGLGVVQD